MNRTDQAQREADRKPAWEIALVAIPGCLASAIAGTLEAFTLANAFRAGAGPRLDVRVFRATPEPVAGFGGAAIPSEPGLDAISEADVVILPPVVGNPEGLPEDNAELVDRLRGAAASPGILAATCTGTFLLAETGSLDGRRATTTPAFREVFHQRYPEVLLRTSLRVVDEGAVITAGATTSYLDLALAVIGRALGPRVVLETARFLSTDPNPRSQQPFLLPRPATPHADQEVRKAEEWIARHLAEPSETASLAKISGLGERTFLRRFRAATGESPREYRQRLRIEAAMKDLEGTNLSIEAITAQCGYEDPRSFRRLFQRYTGVSPGEYRRRFGYGER